MFHQVSWFTYFIAFIIVAGLYYTVVVPIFFKTQIRRFFSRQNEAAGPLATQGGNSTPVNDYVIYEKLRDEITAYLEAEEPEAFKSDVLFSVVAIIKHNPSLENERFRGALGKEIRRLYNQKYNDGLSEEELNSLWQA